MEYGKDNRLDQLLQSYGADRTRWPEAERQRPGMGESEDDARAIDRLLSLASVPDVPDGAAARLMQRIAAEPQGAEIIAFRPRAKPWSIMRYVAALPLAASLALGIYLGAQGSLDFMLPTAVTGEVALGDDVTDELGGVGEADAYAEENLT